MTSYGVEQASVDNSSDMQINSQIKWWGKMQTDHKGKQYECQAEGAFIEQNGDERCLRKLSVIIKRHPSYTF